MTSNATGNDEIQVNTTTTAAQFDPTITTLADGGWLTVWTSDTSGKDLTFFQRFTANGTAVGTEVQVSAEASTFGQTSPVATGLSDGGWVIAWADTSAGGENNDGIFLQRYAADGTTDDTVTQVTLSGSPGDADPTITSLADGGWVVAWLDDAFMLQQRFDASGNQVGDPALINSTFTSIGDQVPALSALADGGWIATWQVGIGTADIFQQQFAEDGSPIGDATKINTTTTGSQQDTAVAALADGGWVVTWESGGGQDGDSFGVYLQRYDSDGNKIGSETLVNSFTTGNQSDPSITALADGGWVVAWESLAQDGDDDGIYLQRYDRDGDRVGGETRVNVTTDGDQEDPSVTALANGGWTVTWEGNDADGNGIFQRVFAADVLGSNLGDRLSGTAFDETVRGFAGNDTLDGRGGDDILQGGFGNDIYGVNSAGDQVQEFASQGSDTVRASISYTLGGSIENIVLTGSGNRAGTGNALANSLTGNGGNNALTGLGGADLLAGGKGADDFVFAATGDSTNKASGRDTILDFSHAQNDDIVLSAIDANSSKGGNQAFSFIGETGFTGEAGELRFFNAGSDSFVQADTNGDRKADLAIVFDGAIDFAKGDFAL